MDARRALIAVATAIVCAVALAGCGSSAKPRKRGPERGSFMAMSVCMRSHGVPNFPDPSPGGGIHISSGINPASPSFRSAQAACFHLLPGGGPGSQKPTKQQIALAVKTSECMRVHGVSGFPDPYVSSGGLPDLNPSKYSQIGDHNGIVIAIPRTVNVTSPAFQNAAKICNFDG
jgi:hypothetical protein